MTEQGFDMIAINVNYKTEKAIILKGGFSILSLLFYDLKQVSIGIGNL